MFMAFKHFCNQQRCPLLAKSMKYRRIFSHWLFKVCPSLFDPVIKIQCYLFMQRVLRDCAVHRL